jgi:NTE family protein
MTEEAMSKRPGTRGWAWTSIRVFALSIVLAGASTQAAPTTQQVAAEPGRPKIGLVLAGGGAKGAAHVGVLKVLEALRIPVDVVVGTSMGSIVGGLYAAGMGPDDIERAIEEIDWVDLFEDAPDRADRSFRRKSDDALYVFKAKPGFSDGQIKVPLAVIQGQKFDLQLNRLTQGVTAVTDFDKLPIPYRAVAADLETGEQVVLKSGSLARSIRASMAVPGAFYPVELDGRLLVDGGIANNIPVSVARELGAEVLIVSELGTDMLTREKIHSGLDVAAQMVNFLFVINSRKQLETLTADDVRISVQLGDIGAGSFDRVKEAIPLGTQAARQVADRLSRYALDEPGYRQHVMARAVPTTGPRTVDFVRIENNSRVSDEVIASHLSVKPGEPLDLARLEHDIQQVYGLEIFESVRYALVEEEGRTGLVVQAAEKSWGPGYLQTGLITSSNFEGDAVFRLGLTYTRTAINALNGEWRLGAQIGDEPGLFGEIFQPFDPGARYFGFAKVSHQTRNVNLIDDEGNKTAEWRAKGFGVEVGVGRQLGTWGEIRLGYLRRTGDLEVGVGAPAPDRPFETGEVFLRLTDDKLDSLYFPRNGHLARAEWLASRKALGADADFDQASYGVQLARTWGRHTLIGGVDVRATVDGTAPIQSMQRLGGFLRLSGFEEGRLSGQQSGLARLVYMRRINDIQRFTAYAGASLEAGNVWAQPGDIGGGDLVVGGSLFIGADTPIGPLYFAYGRNDTGEGSVYLYLGPLFSF